MERMLGETLKRNLQDIERRSLLYDVKVIFDSFALVSALRQR